MNGDSRADWRNLKLTTYYTTLFFSLQMMITYRSCSAALHPWCELNDKSFLGEDVRRPGASAGRPAPPFSLQFTHCHTNSIETETTTKKKIIEFQLKFRITVKKDWRRRREEKYVDLSPPAPTPTGTKSLFAVEKNLKFLFFFQLEIRVSDHFFSLTFAMGVGPPPGSAREIFGIYYFCWLSNSFSIRLAPKAPKKKHI